MAVQAKDQLLHGAEAVWRLDDGGPPSVSLARMGPMREAPDGPFAYRFVGDEQAANPEDLLAAAHVTCYASSLTSVLRNRGLTLREVTLRSVCVVRPEADGSPGIGWRVEEVVLEVVVDGELTEVELQEAHRLAERVCPVSKALVGPVSVRFTGALAADGQRRTSL